jgi:hypothetical protein
VERDGKSLLEWIRIHSLKGLPDLAGPELRFSRTPTASVLRNDACLRLPARNTYIADNTDGNEENLMIMDAATFHKTPAVMKFLHKAYFLMLTAFIPPGLTSYLQPLDTAVNRPFKKLLQQTTDEYIERLEKEKRLPKF